DCLVETDDLGVGRANHQVNLWTAAFQQKTFGMGHERTSEQVALLSGTDCQVIHPASMPVESHHGGSDRLAVFYGNQKEPRLLRSACALYRVVERSRAG